MPRDWRALRLRLLFLIILLAATPLHAHPWGGLVVDANGHVHFTFIAPFVDDDHHAAVWSIPPDGVPKPVLTSRYSPSDIVLSRTGERAVYAAERTGSDQAFVSRLWRVRGSEVEAAIPATTDRSLFSCQAYAVTDAGTVYFADDARLYRRTASGSAAPVTSPFSFDRIDDLAAGPAGSLYVLDRDRIVVLQGDSARVLADGLKDSDPDNLPFAGANILFDLAVADDGTVYVAYFGNRRVLEISPEGEVSALLEAKAPWSPHGLDVHDGSVYVVESGSFRRSWWRFWERSVVVPRVRRVDPDGRVSIIFAYNWDTPLAAR